jgi:cytochrome oxidase Cu insertion factor (SCO1/SenC/PrrC family)
MKLAVAATVGAGVLLGSVVVALYARSSGGEISGRPASTFAGSKAPAGLRLPPFELHDYDGSLVRSGDLLGKVVVLTFLDTKCTVACPIIAGEVAAAWRLLTDDERRQAVAVAISADPRDDTPESIRAFLRTHRAVGTFRYLSGPIPKMKRLWHRFQILSSLESGDADIHSAPVRIYSRESIWLATQHAGADLTPRSLAHDVRVALAGDT